MLYYRKEKDESFNKFRISWKVDASELIDKVHLWGNVTTECQIDIFETSELFASYGM